MKIADRIVAALQPVQLATAGAVFALALAEGGYGGTALGILAVGVWVSVLGTLVVKPVAMDGVRPALVLAGALLAGLALLTAMSLGWTRDAGSGFTEVVRLAAYLGVFVLAGLLAGPGSGRGVLGSLLVAIGATSLVALSARLLGVGGGDEALTRLLPAASGRLSYPVGYWNALGALMALGVPLVVHFASEERRRIAGGAILALGVPLLLTMYMTSSRGALIGAAFGTGVTIALSAERGRAVAAAVVILVAALPAAVVATLASGILDAAGSGAPGGPELAVAASALIGISIALAFGAGIVSRLATLRWLLSSRVRPPPGRVVATILVALIAAFAVLGDPGRLIDDVRSSASSSRTEGGVFVASGSGRVQFWSAALSAFSDEPARGIGAGGYPTYWYQHGSVAAPTLNAHSEPLELLAELGVPDAPSSSASLSRSPSPA